MTEYIKKEDAIEALMPYFMLPIHTKEQFEQAKRIAEGIINTIPLEKRLRWIPVSERLPDEDEDVLVTVYFKGMKTRYSSGYVDITKPCYYVDIAKHIGGEWQSISDEYKVAINRHVVIAWRPLPKPYIEREEGAEE